MTECVALLIPEARSQPATGSAFLTVVGFSFGRTLVSACSRVAGTGVQV